MDRKATARAERAKLIAALLEDQDDHLEKLIETTEKKHANGGLIKSPESYQKTQLCIQAFSEEELDG